MQDQTVLVTGAAGFIGFHLSNALLCAGATVIGVDNLNAYYEVSLKEARLALLSKQPRFIFEKGDIADLQFVATVFEKYTPSYVVNLAAQAGVRYSIENPHAYINSNIVGFFNILEACRIAVGQGRLVHLVYASSSSVYGQSNETPYATSNNVNHPVSLYAATKVADELMAYSYAKLYGLRATGLRFFTVYGPFGRPDMAYYNFTKRILNGETIQIYNNGDMYRDFTYIDDIVEGICSVLPRPPAEDIDGVPHMLYNIGNNKPVLLTEFISLLEKLLLQEGLAAAPASKEFLPMQPGDVYQTYADITDLTRDTGFLPRTNLATGLSHFVQWYKTYYKL